MKNLLLIALPILLFATGCAKKEMGCTPVSPQSEDAQIKAYASADGIAAVKHSSGIYYQIIDSGTGATPTMNSYVYITYTGKLLNGTQFDKASNADSTGWKLGSLIEGWQIGLSFIKKGGRIKLIIPSSLAYSCNGSGSTIPPNSVLYFDITLVDVTTGCKSISPQSEEPLIKNYVAANNINAEKDSSGIYFQIIDTGTGVKPALNSKVYVTYTGRFLNGTQFDQSTNAANTGWILNNLIGGWKVGLPLIKKGGRIKLIVPSSLAYGCTGAGGGVIPPNAVLYFDISLVDVQ